MGLQHTQRVIIIVPAADRAAASAAALTVDPHGGNRTFTQALVLSSDPEDGAPRAYICDWQMTPGERTALAAAFAAAAIDARIHLFDLDRVDPAVARPEPDAVLARATLNRRHGGPLP